jgi:hypothetical protein
MWGWFYCSRIYLLPARQISLHFLTELKISSASAWARFLIIFLTHPNVLRHLLCLHLHLPPLDQNLLLARDAIINPPVVGVKRRRDGEG